MMFYAIYKYSSRILLFLSRRWVATLDSFFISHVPVEHTPETWLNFG